MGKRGTNLVNEGHSPIFYPDSPKYPYVKLSSGIATLGPTGALALPSASVALPSRSYILAYHMIQLII